MRQLDAGSWQRPCGRNASTRFGCARDIIGRRTKEVMGVPRMTDWQRDIHEGLRRENWSLAGPNRIVKVLPFGSVAAALGGYITVGTSLLGKTPLEIEGALGLPHRYLVNGARIYRFI